MRKLLTYIFCGLFLFSISGNALAVEKKNKDKKTTTQKKETQKETEVKKTDSKKTSTVTGKNDSQKKYDIFVDENKNGIDDRRENLKSTSASKSTASNDIKKKEADKKEVKKEVKKDETKDAKKEKKKD